MKKKVYLRELFIMGAEGLRFMFIFLRKTPVRVVKLEEYALSPV
jgi:hypothetical protein